MFIKRALLQTKKEKPIHLLYVKSIKKRLREKSLYIIISIVQCIKLESTIKKEIDRNPI